MGENRGSVNRLHCMSEAAHSKPVRNTSTRLASSLKLTGSQWQHDCQYSANYFFFFFTFDFLFCHLQDGNHKLIEPYRFVIRGGLDDYSRMIVYLHATTDNKASSVLQQFQTAVQSYNLSSRVRCDYGMEKY